METVAKPNRNTALETDSDDDMPLSDRLQSPSKPLNGAKEGAASPDRAAALQPKVPGGQPAQAGGSSNAAGAEAQSAGASGLAPSEPKSKAEAHAAAAKPAGAAQAGPSKAGDGAKAGPTMASDGAKAGSSKAVEPGRTTGAQKAGLSKQAATAGQSRSAGANGKASRAALAANGSLKRKASPVSDSSDSEDDQPLGVLPVPLQSPLSPAACAWTLPTACTPARCGLPFVCHKSELRQAPVLPAAKPCCLHNCTVACCFAGHVSVKHSTHKPRLARSRLWLITGRSRHVRTTPLACSGSQGCDEDSCQEAAGKKACPACQEGGRRGAQAQAAGQEACQAQAQLRRVCRETDFCQLVSAHSIPSCWHWDQPGMCWI